jgi:chromosome segregation ATPase
MTTVLLLLLSILSAGACVAGTSFILAKRGVGVDKNATILERERDTRTKLLEDIKAAYEKLVPVVAIRTALRELATQQENLRAEKGRITITQAELETVDTRLRELEEVERELEASGLETKEEINILKKKENELIAKNKALKDQIDASIQVMDTVMSEIEFSQEVQEKVTACKTELLQVEQNIATLILQIEQGNEQYFVLKRRYDALDIEYAQLFEKFSEAAALVGDKGGDKEK